MNRTKPIRPILVADIAGAAKLLNCSERTVRRLIASNRLPAIEIEGDFGPEWRVVWVPTNNPEALQKYEQVRHLVGAKLVVDVV